MVKLDSTGQIVNSRNYPSAPTNGIYSINWSHAINTNDGNILVVGCNGFKFPGSGAIAGHPGFVKVDENLDTLWTRDFRGEIPVASGINRRLTESLDSSGYIGVGRTFRNGNGHAHIAKVSPEGDSLWHRLYNYEDWEDHEHAFWDVEPTPDGGYIMVGDSRTNLPGEVRQQGYIVKTDEHGCVVPGCHLPDDTTSVSDPVLPQISLSLYPNPASDLLNIFFRYPASAGGGVFSIIDIEGRVLRSFAGTAREVTHVLSVAELASGVYFLRYSEGGRVLRSVRFVKAG